MIGKTEEDAIGTGIGTIRESACRVLRFVRLYVCMFLCLYVLVLFDLSARNCRQLVTHEKRASEAEETNWYMMYMSHEQYGLTIKTEAC